MAESFEKYVSDEEIGWQLKGKISCHVRHSSCGKAFTMRTKSDTTGHIYLSARSELSVRLAEQKKTWNTF
jgi:hypothetical protein